MSVVHLSGRQQTAGYFLGEAREAREARVVVVVTTDAEAHTPIVAIVMTYIGPHSYASG